MDEDQKKEKPFDTVSIVLLILISLASDISDLVTDLVALVPVLGQIVYFANSFLISPITWAIIQIWFIMKVGLSGRKGLITGVANLFGGLGNIANLPGSETIMTTIAIVVANHEGLAKVAALGKAATGATAGAAAKRKQFSLPQQPAVATAGVTTGTQQEAMTSATAEAPPAIISDEFEPPGIIREGRPAISEEEFGVEKEPLEKLKEVMEKIPEPQEKREGGNI